MVMQLFRQTAQIVRLQQHFYKTAQVLHAAFCLFFDYFDTNYILNL